MLMFEIEVDQISNKKIFIMFLTFFYDPTSVGKQYHDGYLILCYL